MNGLNRWIRAGWKGLFLDSQRIFREPFMCPGQCVKFFGPAFFHFSKALSYNCSQILMIQKNKKCLFNV